ncbi:MAG: peptidase C45 [Bacteroidetes bacterium]|nr:MAG: peptidase C45 [Bacteroidota bacterium]
MSKYRFTFKKFLKYFFSALLIFLIGFSIYFFQAIKMPPPKVTDRSSLKEKRETFGTNFYGIKNNRFRKSESGLYELYIEGNAFERGVYNGKLTAELGKKQEDAFVEEIKKMIPSQRLLNFMKYMTAWFNRNMDEYVPQEYLEEIYGVSESASKDYLYIGDNYSRILNYHAAHDIGHAVQNVAKVGCTSFSCNHSKSADGHLIIGRNFDFYVGDKFAEDKIVTFYNPNKGYKFVEITWGGFIGTVSGMNDQGLTVTLNAAKSEIPFSSADPISLIAREILQYAGNINEAFEIAKKRKSFVSEAIMIGSAKDNATAIIEKTPKDCALFYPKSDIVIGLNHFQSDKFKNTELNLENIKESSSMYRYKRMSELIGSYDTIGYREAANILRNKRGLHDANIGMGNEKNICQLISHHSIIFKPDELKFWISTNPYQLGKYVCYDLDSVFAEFPAMTENKELYIDDLSVPPDSFLYSDDYEHFKYFQKQKDIFKAAVKDTSVIIKDAEIQRFISSNPEYFYTYQLVGDYYFTKGKQEDAKQYYKLALTKEVTTLSERIDIVERLKEISDKELE